MKPYAELTRGGQMRRIAASAREALTAWGLEGAPLRTGHHRHNTTFRVGARYALRAARPDYQSDAALQSEVLFLEHLADGHVGTPIPVRTCQGQAFALAGEHRFLLFHWTPGRRIRARLGHHNARAQGQLVARLHERSVTFEPPAGFERRRLSAETLCGEATGFSRELVRSRLAPDALAMIDAASEIVRQTFEELVERVIVHGDITPGNTLWALGRPRLIDFDDMAWGPLAYDLAVVCDAYQKDVPAEGVWRVFLDGYGSTRKLPLGLDTHLDGLLLGRRVLDALWLAGMMDDPAFRDAPALLERELTAIRETLGRSARV